MSKLLRDIRFALRQATRHPGTSALAMITLTLAVSANTIIFSIANGLLLRPLPFPEADRLGILIRHQQGVSPKTGHLDREDSPRHSAEIFASVRNHVPSVRVAAVGGTGGVNFSTRSTRTPDVRFVQDMRVSAKYFDVLGVEPYLGRSFTEEEDRPGGPNSVVLSYSLWQSAFHSDVQVLGKVISLKGDSYTVVGILPPGVQTTGIADLWTALKPHNGGECAGENCKILLRLARGASWQQANSELSNLRSTVFDKSAAENPTTTWFYASPLTHDLDNDVRKPVLMLMLAVGMILLIACANLAGLTLVNISRREPELATRLAVGATGWEILRQLWMENVLLAFIAGAASILCAFIALRLLSGFLPLYMRPVAGMTIDMRVLAFTFAASLLASLLFGALPTMRLRRLDLRSSIAAGSHTIVGRSNRLRQVFVCAEVALTIVLLCSAGLLIRTMIHLRKVPSGFDAARVITGKVSLDDANYHNAASFRKLVNASLSNMRQIPGVEDAAVGLSLPYERGLNYSVKIRDGAFAGKTWAASAVYVSPGYFSTLRIPILAGRSISEADTPDSEFVTVINSDFAREFFGESRPIGLHIEIAGRTYTVVGIAVSVAKRPGMSKDVPLSTEPVFYIPAMQVDQTIINLAHIWFQPSWLIRTSPHVQGVTYAMQHALTQADPGLPFSGFYSMQDLLSESIAYQRVEVAFLTSLAGLALLLSAVGIYGLVSHLVAERTREIGIRIALGSSTCQAMRAVGSSGIRAGTTGLLAGFGASLLALRILQSELYGVSYYDPGTFGAVFIVIVLIVAVASFLPTLRITRMDPAKTLRSE